MTRWGNDWEDGPLLLPEDGLRSLSYVLGWGLGVTLSCLGVLWLLLP